jgi:hypothetical protein
MVPYLVINGVDICVITNKSAHQPCHLTLFLRSGSSGPPIWMITAFQRGRRIIWHLFGMVVRRGKKGSAIEISTLWATTGRCCEELESKY